MWANQKYVCYCIQYTMQSINEVSNYKKKNNLYGSLKYVRTYLCK